MRHSLGKFCLLVLLLSSFLGLANVRVGSGQDQVVPAPQIQTETKATGYPGGACSIMVQHGPDFAGSWGVREDSDADNGLNVGWSGGIFSNVSGTSARYLFQYNLYSCMNSIYSWVYINCSGEMIPIYLYKCSSFDMVTSDVTRSGGVPTFTNTITFHDIQLETYGNGSSSVTLVFTQHFTADWTLLTVKTDVYADLTNLKLYTSNGTEVPDNTSFSLNLDYMVGLSTNQTSEGNSWTPILPSRITQDAIYYDVAGAGGMQYSLANMTLGDGYTELQGNTQVAGKTATAYFTQGYTWTLGCDCIQTFSDLTYGLTTGIESDPTIHVQHTRVPVYWGTASTPTPASTPTSTPASTPTASTQATSTPTPEPQPFVPPILTYFGIGLAAVVILALAGLLIRRRKKLPTSSV